MLCNTIAASMPIGLLATACRRGKHIDTTHDDRAEEGVFLGNNLTNPNFWMDSFRGKKVMMLSDPKHCDHISCSLGMFPIVFL